MCALAAVLRPWLHRGEWVGLLLIIRSALLLALLLLALLLALPVIVLAGRLHRYGYGFVFWTSVKL